jgi:hypothetical protein
MDDIQHIKFERTGGFMGMRVAAEFDLDDLPDEQARQLCKLLDDTDFDELPETLSSESQISDGYSYSITVEAGKVSHTVTIPSGAPEKLHPLLDLLSQIARQFMRKK